ncbi:hypothetical protein BJ964_005199 [Actinoplanes lobatus]|uniref:Uncharacterized protein n=1 Tax=Actinoplanes lobatus TaxID=113568 RepID=A0A7W7MI47_9ACTN|nr:hypothetical protein [Actinoplanes lobatus]
MSPSTTDSVLIATNIKRMCIDGDKWIAGAGS